MENIQNFQIFWFVLILILFIGYSLLDGFDLGIGALLPFIGKTKEDTVFDLTGALADKDLEKALLNLKDLFDHGPGEGGDRRGDRGRGESVGGNAVSGHGAAGVEAVPAHPEHAGAHHAEHHAVRSHFLPAEAETGSDDEAEDKR